MSGGRGIGGNREVSPLVLLSRAAWAEAHPEEGGSWGKHGFPHGSEPQASDAHTARRSVYASSARVTATPRSMSAPASASASSSAASDVVMSNTSNQPMWPM